MSRSTCAASAQHQRWTGMRHLSPCFLCGLLLPLLLCASSFASAAPADMQAVMRDNRTFAFFVEGAEVISSTGHTAYRWFYGLELAFVFAQFVSIFTTEENLMVKDLLQTLANNMEVYPSTPAPAMRPFPTDLTLSKADVRYQLAAKAYLKASPVSDCSHTLKLCCPLYWRGPNLTNGLPSSKVPQANMFWDGSRAINGFFTNFTAAYLSSIQCNKEDSGTHLAVDMNGEWRFISPFSTAALREYDMTDAMGKSPSEPGVSRIQAWLRKQAAAAESVLGRNPEDILQNASHPGGNLSEPGGTPVALAEYFIPMVPSVAAPAALLVVLLLELTALYALDMRPRCKRLAAYRLQFPEAALDTSGQDEISSSRQQRSRRRTAHEQRQQPGDAYVASSSSSSSAASSVTRSSRSPSPSSARVSAVAKKLSPTPSSATTGTAAATPPSGQCLPRHTQQRSLSHLEPSSSSSPPITPMLPRAGSFVGQPQFPAQPPLTHTRTGSFHDGVPNPMAAMPTTGGGGGSGSTGMLDEMEGSRRVSPGGSSASPRLLPSMQRQGSGGSVSFAGVTLPHSLPQLPAAPMMMMMPGGGSGANPGFPMQQQQQQQQHPATAFPRTPSFGHMVNSRNGSFNSTSVTHAFTGNPATATPTTMMMGAEMAQQQMDTMRQQQQQRKPSPVPPQSSTSILIKESSFRKDKRSGHNGQSFRQSASSSIASPSSVGKHNAMPQAKRLSSAPSSLAAATAPDAALAHDPSEETGSSSRRRRDRATPELQSRPNPFKKRDSFRKAFH